MFLLQGMGMILANLLAIGIIVLVAWFFLRRGPVTESKLRRMVKADAVPARDVLPCGGDLGATGALLRALDLGGQPRDLIRALMVDWVQQKAVFTRSSPKKKLRSFGADVQLELYFPEESPALSGAAALLYDAVRSWAEEDGSLQQSELYQAARNDAQRVDNIVLQLVHEGRRSLRDKGGCAPESKKSKFGLSDDNRELYTPKGIRLARETAAFVHFASSDLCGQAAVLAAAAGKIEQNDPACVLADAIFDGMTAGKQVSR